MLAVCTVGSAVSFSLHALPEMGMEVPVFGWFMALTALRSSFHAGVCISLCISLCVYLCAVVCAVCAVCTHMLYRMC